MKYLNLIILIVLCLGCVSEKTKKGINENIVKLNNDTTISYEGIDIKIDKGFLDSMDKSATVEISKVDNVYDLIVNHITTIDSNGYPIFVNEFYQIGMEKGTGSIENPLNGIEVSIPGNDSLVFLEAEQSSEIDCFYLKDGKYAVRQDTAYTFSGTLEDYIILKKLIIDTVPSILKLSAPGWFSVASKLINTDLKLVDFSISLKNYDKENIMFYAKSKNNYVLIPGTIEGDNVKFKNLVENDSVVVIGVENIEKGKQKWAIQPFNSSDKGAAIRLKKKSFSKFKETLNEYFPPLPSVNKLKLVKGD